MFSSFRSWLHHLFNPHCFQCEIESECLTCKVLEHQLAVANDQIRALTSAIAGTLSPKLVETPTENSENIRPILPRMRMPSRVRMELEENDRAMAQAKVAKEKEIAEAAKVAPVESGETTEEYLLKDLDEEIAEVKAARDAKVN